MILFLFALIYAFVFVPNQLFFRTYALDLGLYTHAAISYAHGHMADCMLFLGIRQPLLADHFDLHLILWSPLTWLFGQWTLLVVQWVAVLLGGWGMWRWLGELGASTTMANLGLVHFLVFFGIYGAFTFDFHSNVVATMAFPWYGLALAKRRKRDAWLLLLFMLSAKENMGIWMCFVALGFLVHNRKKPEMRGLLASQAVFALLWSAVVIGFVMPALSDGAHYAGWRYPALGSGPIDALRTIALHPMHVFQALLDGGELPEGRAIKVEMLVLLFIAGGWAVLMRPWILLMTVPLLLQKLLHAGPAQWGVLGHYSVEFAPLITLAVFSWPSVLRNTRGARIVAVTAVVLSLSASVHIMDASVYKENRAKQRIYKAEHFRRDLDAGAVRKMLRAIPDNASVSASAAFVPHLVAHRHLYQFPILADADVLALATEEEPYPLSANEFNFALDTLRRSLSWTEMDRCDGAVVYRRSGR